MLKSRPLLNRSKAPTIRPTNPHIAGHRFHRVGANHYASDNHTLKECISFAYDLPPGLISGGPDWINSAKYDIVLPTPPNLDRMGVLPTFQAFLADRFKLLLHHEPKLLPIYNLVIGDSELKLTKSTVSHQGQSLLIGGTPQGMILPARNATMVEFVSILQRLILDRPVVDKTGLPGRYDFDLKWARPGPDAITGVQQLGLGLDPAEAIVDTLVVDFIEKPDAN